MIEGLLWYADCRLLALEQVRSLKAPADLRLMRLSHGLYLQHLHALLDLGREVDADLPRRWEAEIAGEGSGENNAAYLRELRNMFVHRETDPTSRGTIVENYVCVLAPEQVWGQVRRSGGRTGPYEAFDPLLWNMFALAEGALPRALRPLVERTETHLLSFDVGTARQQYFEAVTLQTRMPPEIAALALGAADHIVFEEVNAHQFGRVQRLLGTPIAMPQLALPT
jgi:hypothetical protein